MSKPPPKTTPPVKKEDPNGYEERKTCGKQESVGQDHTFNPQMDAFMRAQNLAGQNLHINNPASHCGLPSMYPLGNPLYPFLYHPFAGFPYNPFMSVMSPQVPTVVNVMNPTITIIVRIIISGSYTASI